MATGEPVRGRELSIGEFARWSRLPVSTLRYYHELGVLEPSRVDESSGYRYYAPTQLETAVMVSDLRRLGMPPAQIAAITNGDVEFSTALAAHRCRLAVEIEDRRKAVARLDDLLVAHARRRLHHVTVESRSPSLMVSVSGTTPSQSGALRIRRLIVSLRAQLRAAGVADPTWYGAIFPLDLETDPVATVVYADISPPLPDSIPTVKLPGGDYAVTFHNGDGPLASAYAALRDWCGANHRKPAGVVVEEYRARDVIVAIGLEPGT